MKASVNFGQRGFTLVELIMVIVIMGLIGGMVSVFMKSPIDAYVDSGRRAALSDVTDTAVRRISRDLHKALPNSIRDDFGHQCLSFIPTRTGGRYRAQDLIPGDGTGLDFAAAAGDGSFNMLGDSSALSSDQQIKSGDLIAIYNLGIPGSDAYVYAANPITNTAVVATIATGAETAINLLAAKQFPFESPTHRFQVIPGDERVVTYGCALDAQNQSNLYRSVSATGPLTLPVACPGASGQKLATNTTCSFDYSGSDLQRNALVRITLNVSSQGESVSLYHEVHVNNTP